MRFGFWLISLFPLLPPVPISVPKLCPGNSRWVCSGDTGIVAEIGNSFLSKKVLVEQSFPGNFGRILLYETENTIDENIRLAPHFARSHAPVDGRLAFNDGNRPERIHGDVLRTNS